MNDTIHNYAIDQVWCSPWQDNSVIVKPALISPRSGSGNVVTVLGRQLTLPTPAFRYDVYQVGAIYPSFFGLIDYNPSYVQEHWVSFEECLQTSNLIAQVYNQDGIEFPKSMVFYCLTRERNLLFCVRRLPGVKINYPETELYFRFYTNAYFQSDRYQSGVDFTYSRSLVAGSLNDINDMQADVAQYTAKTGATLCFVNGMIRDTLGLPTAQVGDSLEYIYDSTVKKIVRFPLTSLESFVSTLDNEYKYLMTYDDTENNVIDFEDDIDFWLLYKSSETPLRYRGLYLGRNTPEAIRMVTHREYSLKVSDVTNTRNSLTRLLNADALLDSALEIMMIVRKAGYDRPLTMDSSRIFEMFKLPYNVRKSVMIGQNASMPEWRAAGLEHSAYIQLMREDYNSITMSLIQEALGYNGITKLTGNSPMSNESPVGSVSMCTLPVGLQVKSTVFEYTGDGLLSSVVQHQNGERHYSGTSDPANFEVLSGLSGEDPSVTFSTIMFTLNPECEYRLYRCSIVAGIWQDNWVDVTDSEEYVVTGTSLVIVDNAASNMYMLRTSEKFLVRSFDVMPVGGNYFFSLTERVDRGLGLFDHFVHVPPALIKVFLNKVPLIEGIDYIVNFPKVHIVSKKFLVSPYSQTPQHVDVVCYGFCESDCVYNPRSDNGFIEHGYLSNNRQYDLRDDKILSITVEGSYRHPNTLQFSEEHTGVQITNALNGSPYQVSYLELPIWGLENNTASKFRAESKVMDKKVTDFMTQLKPQPDRGTLMVIPQRYELVSPFFQHVIFDLLNGNFVDVDLTNAFTDMKVQQLCAPLEYLLEYDPISPKNKLDERYTVIHPHSWPIAVQLSLVKYRFLNNVVRLYGRGLISLTNFVTITS